MFSEHAGQYKGNDTLGSGLIAVELNDWLKLSCKVREVIISVTHAQTVTQREEITQLRKQ